MYFYPTMITVARLGLILLPVSAVFAANINVQILSATIKDQKIAGATAILQQHGEQSIAATSNAQGQLALNTTFNDDNGSLLILKKTGYSDLVVKCPCAGMTYAMSPVMKNLDGMRIVLNWGATPKDLDSHVVFPDNHVYFSNKNGDDANLDVDDTTSYGPETITLSRKHAGERYVYAVHNFTDRDKLRSSTLSTSGAKVFVYVGQTLMRTYYVPQNKQGNLWTVFAVTENGDFQDYNSIEGVASEDRLQTAAFQGVINQAVTTTASYSASGVVAAKNLNTQGEQAYHAGQLDQAISLYQAAIEQQGDYGQAYSNLGLAFQKAGRVAEALWANRKALALANGDNANIVRASSHFNNGKIYEAAAQWNDALREFKAAKAENSNPAYDKAIARVKAQGAR